MNRYLSVNMGAQSTSIESIVGWIENIIQTSTSPDHREVCENLVTNFVNNLLLYNQDYVNYTKLESKLRKFISQKFQNI
jgi:hypothetical protein